MQPSVITDPHIIIAIACIGSAVIAALVLFVLILADMESKTNNDDDDKHDHPKLPPPMFGPF